MTPKLKVAVIFGGTNTEHEVSLVSGRAILDNLDKNKYDVTPIKITKENTWISPKELSASYTPVLPDKIVEASRAIDSIDDLMEDHSFDVVFPVLHGPYGEDGTVQGLLELMRLPYVGCGVTGSAVCMDKVLQKNVCLSYNIPVAPFFWFTKGEWEEDRVKVLTNLEHKFNGAYPLFVKPVNQGSSVGVSKAHDKDELIAGITTALTRDIKIIVEKGIKNVREIECSVLGVTHKPESSVLGEIIPDQEFYSYESKYLSGQSQAVIPAKLPQDLTEKIQACARLAFQVLDCYGLARIDFLLDGETNEFYLNELNTMPGFTPISMYPKLWAASGLTYSDLLDRLIELAIKRHDAKSTISTNI